MHRYHIALDVDITGTFDTEKMLLALMAQAVGAFEKRGDIASVHVALVDRKSNRAVEAVGKAEPTP